MSILRVQMLLFSLTPGLGVKLKVLGYPTPLVGLEGNPSHETSTVLKVRKTSYTISSSATQC